MALFFVGWSAFCAVYEAAAGNWGMVVFHVVILVMWVFILKPDRTLFAYWDWRYRTSTRYADKMDRKYRNHNNGRGN